MLKGHFIAAKSHRKYILKLILKFLYPTTITVSSVFLADMNNCTVSIFMYQEFLYDVFKCLRAHIRPVPTKQISWSRIHFKLQC